MVHPGRRSEVSTPRAEWRTRSGTSRIAPSVFAAEAVKFAALRPVTLVLSRELALTALLLLGVSFVVFVILFLAPGDPFSVLLEGQMPSHEARVGVRDALGVHKTWYVHRAT